MMNDLIERLRKEGKYKRESPYAELCDEASDEIERLTKHVEQYHMALFEAEAKLAAVELENEELRNAIDQEMVTTYLGVFNRGDDPVKAIKELMLWSQGVGEYFAKEELASLKQQLAEAKKDAERYRWLREGGVYQWFDSTSNVSLDNLDAAIDQAMREGE